MLKQRTTEKVLVCVALVLAAITTVLSVTIKPQPIVAAVTYDATETQAEVANITSSDNAHVSSNEDEQTTVSSSEFASSVYEKTTAKQQSRGANQTKPKTTKIGKTNGVININTATATELMQLNGIGEALSQRIVDYRNSNGKFNSIEDIKNVSGIGEKRFESIKEHITVN